MEVSHIITGGSITYENGAEVGTSFLTNMDKYLCRSVPELTEIIERENKKNVKAGKKELPKYEYPAQVLTAAALGYMSKHGVEYKVKKGDAIFVRALDSMRAVGKVIFGGGFLLAERAAAERAAATTWELSERERAMIKELR